MSKKKKKQPKTAHTPPPFPPALVLTPEEIPPMPEVDEPGRRATLGVRMRRDELRRIHDTARARGMSVSSFVRAALCNLGLLDTLVAEIEE